MSPSRDHRDHPKATLYTWPSSVWSTVPKLCLIEKGYNEDECKNILVDLDHGENFSPEYLRINPNGTIPTLVVPTLDTNSPNMEDRFKYLRDTKTICDFLDQARTPSSVSPMSPRDAPTLVPPTVEGKILSDSIIAYVHLPALDPNFLNLTARNLAELDIKSKGWAEQMLQARHDNLINYIERGKGDENGILDQNILSMMDEKLKANDSLLGVFQRTAPIEMVNAFLVASEKSWKEVIPDALKDLEEIITGPFVFGEQISLADLHIISWLTRVISITNGQPDESGYNSLIAYLNGRRAGGPRLFSFWQSWVGRESFQRVLVAAYGSFQSTMDTW